MSLTRYLLSSRLNWLALLLPAALVLRLLGAGDVPIFLTSTLAVVPLAALIGHATDELSKYTGPGVGGFLNASLGNAAEIVIILLALRAGLTEVVKASITGSILGNLLLVLGLAIFVGGWGRECQRFNRTAVGATTALLVLGAAALLFPDVYELSRRGGSQTELMAWSLLSAAVMLATYAGSLVFSLRTHRHLLSAAEHEEGEPPRISRRDALLVLGLAALLTAVAAEALVGSVENAAHALGLSDLFVGAVVVAVIGNAAEHVAAVWLAREDKMDLAVNIAISSGAQVALLVAPIAVFASVLLGHPMPLVFTEIELAAIIVAVVGVRMVAEDGESNWLEGLQLLSLWLLAALAFYFIGR
ncbi:MAG TPA: calcium/proton exchanger [Chloroflexota bacterium]|nr:calcium/proton exchanger [Chloroflexota bacterium]